MSQGGDKKAARLCVSVDRNVTFQTGDARAATALIPGFQKVTRIDDHAMIGSLRTCFFSPGASTETAKSTLELIGVPDASTREADIARKNRSHL